MLLTLASLERVREYCRPQLFRQKLRRQRRDVDELLSENADVQNLAALAARMRQRAQIESKGMFAANS